MKAKRNPIAGAFLTLSLSLATFTGALAQDASAGKIYSIRALGEETASA